MPLSTPVALFVFNRPAQTQQVFARIRAARPKRLFLAADGARDERERARCDEVRAIVSRVDWDCEVRRNYSDVNLGCATRIASAVSWVFESCDDAIFLEDDTLPSASFFPFCEAILERYRDDQRVMHVAGNNFQGGHVRGPYSYFFSRYTHIWGWATWRRAWKHYDFGMSAWPEFRQQGLMRSVCDDAYEASYWSGEFDRMATDSLAYNDWGLQWMFACWSRSGLAVHPQVNLVANVGFGPEATHTTSAPDFAQVPAMEMPAVVHSPFVVRSREADTYTFDHVFGGASRRRHAAVRMMARASGIARKRVRRLFVR